MTTPDPKGTTQDSVNDAPALRAADIGISVDTATDIAKESADLILLEKDLMVLEGGVIEGRKVFANILKYIRMGRVLTSATCSACWERAPFYLSFQWHRFRY